jgi:hypothetical protein
LILEATPPGQPLAADVRDAQLKAAAPPGVAPADGAGAQNRLIVSEPAAAPSPASLIKSEGKPP